MTQQDNTLKGYIFIIFSVFYVLGYFGLLGLIGFMFNIPATSNAYFWFVVLGSFLYGGMCVYWTANSFYKALR